MSISTARAGLFLLAGLTLFSHARAALAYCGPGGCGGEIDSDPGPEPGPEPQYQLTNRHAILWQGFHHAWDHEPHRMGDFENVLLGTGHGPSNGGYVTEARRWATFLPGQDGDEGDVRTFSRSVVKAGLRTFQSEWVVSLSNTVDRDREDQQAAVRWEGDLTIDVGQAGIGFEEYGVFMRGVDVDITNMDGATSYMWPTVFDTNIDGCTRAGDVLTCHVEVEIVREDAPDPHKDIPEEETRLDYRIAIPYTVVLGSASTFLVGPPRTHAVTTCDFFDGPRDIGVVETSLDPTYEVAMTGITGVRFELWSGEDKDGRYLHAYDFHVEDGVFDAANGTLASTVTLGVGRVRDDHSRWDANFDAELRTRVLQVRAEPECADATTVETTDHVCLEAGFSWYYMPPCADPQTTVINDVDRWFPAGCL